MVRNSPRARGRLEQVGGIRAAGLTARADQRMGLVDEQDGRPGRCLHLSMTPLRRRSNSPFTLAPACTGPCRGTTARRPSAGGDPRGQAFDDGGLADASLADHDGVVFRRRARMSTIWRIAPSRQSTGSSLPSRACWVRLWVKRCNRDSPPPGLPLGAPAAAKSSTARCRARQQRLVAAAGIAQRVA